MDYSSFFLTYYVFFILFFDFLVLSFTGVCYIFRSLGIMGMMKKFGMNNPGTAFVPIYGEYLFGKVAEESALRFNGRKPLPFGKIMLFGKAGYAAFVFIFSLLWVVISAFLPAMKGMASGAMIALLVIMCGLTLIASLAAVAVTAFEYIALYNVYNCFAPDNAVMFTVISILVNVAMPFLLFSIRNKEPLSPVIDVDPESEPQ